MTDPRIKWLRRVFPSVILAIGLCGCTAQRDRELASAILGNDFPKAEKLIADGANVDYCGGQDRETTLMLAAASVDTPAVEFLIKAKANVNARGHKGLTPLMYAAINGRQKHIELLVAAGADVNAKADGGQTAVSIAKARRHLEVVEALKALGASDDEARDVT